jgi:protein-L-isoaspartate(D-aspartate) O-methyltransferase
MAEQPAQDIARNLMVDAQIRPNQVNDRRIIAAMRQLPREDFVPAGQLAYTDADVPLGGGRYLLAPMLTAKLTQAVLASNPVSLLVVGAGAGYAAAILNLSGAQVVALEEEALMTGPALAQAAPNVQAVTGPLEAGWPAGGPYDVIFIDGAVARIPDSFVSQLTPSGRVIAILADSAAPHGLGRAVVAQPGPGGFASTPLFDCTARILPAFQPAPAFTF